MKNLTLKSLFVFLLTLSASQVSAQESESTVVDGPKEAACNPFPMCKWLDGSGDTVTDDAKSQWALLWEQLTKEMKEAVESLPTPTQPE